MNLCNTASIWKQSILQAVFPWSVGPIYLNAGSPHGPEAQKVYGVYDSIGHDTGP